jgi:hypothetical protein
MSGLLMCLPLAQVLGLALQAPQAALLPHL